MDGNRTMQVIMCLFVIPALILTLSTNAFSQEIQETIDHEAGFYYTIQRGDTLWDLSDSFFDTPWFWPELWKENDQIPNPHRIYPGERIRLFQKKGTDTFTLKMPEQENMAQETSSDTEMAQTDVQEPEKETVYYMYPSIDAIGFIRKEAVDPLGYIFKAKEDKLLIKEGDTVYINYAGKDDSQIMQGGRYAVYRKLDPTKDHKRNKILGGQYYVLGAVEVVKKEADFFIARVVKSYRAIEVNDFILPYIKRSPKIPVTESVKDLVGKIIISEDHLELIGDFTTAFIDKGADDNVAPGQIYSLFYQEKEALNPGGKKSVALDPVDYGKLIVLHTEKNTSTVLVTQADRHASPGTLIRTPID